MPVLEDTSPPAVAARFPLLTEAGKRGPFRLFLVAMTAAFMAAGFAASDARAETVDLRVDVSGLRNYRGRVVVMLWADSGK